MHVLSAGGFFHDLNFSYISTDDLGSLISVEEERFSRIKSHSILNSTVKTNYLSLKYISEKAGVALDQINVLVLSDERSPACLEDLKSLLPNAEIVFGHHYHSHVGNVLALNSQTYADNAFVLALDGYGDGLSGICGTMDNCSLIVDHTYSSDNSLGLLYTSATQHLGLGGFGSEGKMQGLAPYGKYREEFSINSYFSVSNLDYAIDPELLVKDDFADQELYAVQAISSNKTFERIIDKRFRDEELTQDHCDFAFTIQSDIFSIILRLISNSHVDGSARDLIFSGGLAQNSTLVNRISELPFINRVITSSSCSDRGNSLGALFMYLDSIKVMLGPVSPFLGYDLCDALQTPIDPISRKTAISIAQLIDQGQVVAFLDGKAELGARALCNRSILASPKSSSMKDRLNSRVKHREGFRPFAPVVKHSNFDKYFCGSPTDCSSMTRCVPVKPTTSLDYPSAVHVDQTARVQVISSSCKRSISYLMDACQDVGHDILINTSLNDNGMPIVNDLTQAMQCLSAMDIDAVVIGDEIITKN